MDGLPVSDDSADRRRHLRAPVSLMGTVEGEGGEQPVVILDLSASGAMIQADEPAAPDGVYTLRFNVHKQAYELRFRVVQSLQKGASFGWRGPFVDLSPDQMEAIGKAVNAAAGVTGGTVRPWAEIASEAERQPEATLPVGTTASGHDITVLAKDVLEMGPEGLELYARLMSELETM